MSLLSPLSFIAIRKAIAAHTALPTLFAGVLLLPALLLTISHSFRNGHVQAASASAAGPRPVLVELFTSEGCSSCPPADALLARLDAEQFVPGAQAIVLSEHVTYWDDLGTPNDRWRDPFSSQVFTDRQNLYALRFGLRGPYTPQAVVDGAREFNGSDRGALIKALTEAVLAPKTPVTLSQVHLSGDTVSAEVEVAPEAGGLHAVKLVAALADEAAQSSVLRGENSGRNLRHVAVVRTLREFGKLSGSASSAPLRKAIEIRLNSGGAPGNSSVNASGLRLIVFLADARDGHIVGAAMQPVAR